MPASMSRPEAEAYLDQFFKDLNALLAKRMSGKNTIGAAESGIIRNAMLHIAGYLEAMQHAGFGVTPSAALRDLAIELENSAPIGMCWIPDGVMKREMPAPLQHRSTTANSR